jgi:ATP-dependent DNA helicase RecG
MSTARVAEASAPSKTHDPPRAFATGGRQERAGLSAVPLRSRTRPSRLAAGIATLRGAGPRLAEAAAEIGIESLGDLLWHVPHGYRDRTALSEIAELRIGQEATVLATVRTARVRPTRRRGLTILEATVADASGPAKAVWFNQPWLADQLAEGTRVLLHGKLDKSGFRVDAHEVVREGDEDAPTGLHTTGIVPVHPASARLRPQKIRDWEWQVKELVRAAIEPLPASLRTRNGLVGAGDALAAVHFPADLHQAETARERLAFEELFLHQAALASRRGRHDTSRRSPGLDPSGELTREWIASLPFDLTGDQRRATEEIDADLSGELPMQRLLMGEVGSGKTVCALFAMLRAVESGHQAALMAPTETLAEQHFQTLERLLTGAGLPSAALLTGSTSPARRRDALGHLATGQLELVVGTHALIEEGVEFARLGLAVVDEQHRFGVRQRAALDAKGPGDAAPHTLHMTATPIPRTLSLTAYGDLDVTALHELPAGRRPVKTWVVGEEKRAGAYEFIRERLREGRQAFVVCPLVSESDKLQARAATKEGERLARGEFREFKLDVLHGQMKAADKQRAMAGFASGDTAVLVATSVIEVGIDVPNASVMVIEEADRYGLSQLHQLRGRVGRGEHESHCILFADTEAEAATIRLEAISSERDGFKLAEVDLSLRGEGEILGTRQHGLPRFRVATLPEDSGTLLRAREEVLALVRRHGSLEAPELGPLMDAARLRFGDERADPIAA